MDKIKTVKIKEQDGSISEESYFISVDAKNVDMDNKKQLQETIGNIDIDNDGDIATQLKNKINKVDIIDNLDSDSSNKVLSAKQGKVLGDSISNLNSNVNKKVYYFNTVADMKNANLKNGDVVQTLGYYEINDDGSATYKITDIESQSEYQEEVGDLYATLIVNDYVTPQQFGAYGDEIHNDTLAIQKCIDYSTNKKYEINLTKKYLIEPSIHPVSYPSYNVGLIMKSNLTIRGNGFNTGFIIDDTNHPVYWSLFFPDTVSGVENTILENFSFYQKNENLSNMGYTAKNPRCILAFVGTLKNFMINNVLFDNVYGTNVIVIDCRNSKNINISNCIFNFKSILSTVSSYDCSVLYLKCKDYICNNNKLNGDNFSCVGGIELHGYNGVCKNNIITEFKDCINVAPNYDKPANFIIESNTLYGYDGIVLWDNINSDATTGAEDIKILNNKISVESGSATRTVVAGIKTTDSSFTHQIKNLFIKNNIIDFINYNDTNNISLAYSGGININRNIDMLDFIISDNIITNSPGAGISIGSTSSNSTLNMKDIIINNNIIKNSSVKTTGNDGYKGAICINYKNSGNISIKNNILTNEIENGGSLYAIINSSTILEGYKNYIYDNIIKTVTSGKMTTSGTTSFRFRRDTQYPIESPNGTRYYIKINNEGTLSIST